MRITRLKTNRITNPLGFKLDKAKVSFVVEDTEAKKIDKSLIEISLDMNFNELIFTTGFSEEIDSLGFEIPLELKSCTRYYWRVTVCADNGDMVTSDIAWFETGKLNNLWQGQWITALMPSEEHPVLMKEFIIDKEIISARAYVSGLGLYEFAINENKVGDEYFAPGCNAYDKWIQYQTYDITSEIKVGNNVVEVLLGNGWYKGNFGFEGGKDNIYGDKFAFICDIEIKFSDGTNMIVPSDLSWEATESKVKSSSIYHGEVYDESFIATNNYEVSILDLGTEKLIERLSLPVVIKERVKPIEIIRTPLDEIVLDMGQNMTGWVEFEVNEPLGKSVTLQFGEILQEGNFYRENLRFAKAQFTYISDGKKKNVRPHFTYFGFRYVKLIGFTNHINLEDFNGAVLYSDMEVTGEIETSNRLVNKLFLNAMWGQKGNFLDVPTDCPQRDERMGWTGDAQVFSGTASFNMDSYAFFSKYLYDLAKEQQKTGGSVPMVIPRMTIDDGCSSAWGDAATIIPWNMFIQFGDKRILENQYESMKSWVDFIKKEDENNGDNRLWDSGFHFGDWLALDGENPKLPVGGTEENFIASAYYCYSAGIVSKAAKILGLEDDEKEYDKLSQEIRQAIIDEYFTKNGRLALKNQTAYVVALYMGLVPEEFQERVAKDLNNRLIKDKGYLKTGFVGSPFVCNVLSRYGYNEMAYKLLLNKECPSWLYPITMGATTIWERWNSVLPDGKINPEGMNSLNHYAYGSIVEWMYRVMAGINPSEEGPGFRHVNLNPMPDYRIKFVKAMYDSPVGTYRSMWRINDNGSLYFKFNIPFNSTASLTLPHADLQNVLVNGKNLVNGNIEYGEDIIQLSSGVYEFEYMPTQSYVKYYSTSMSLKDLLSNDEVKSILMTKLKAVAQLPEYMISLAGDMSIREMSNKPFFNTSIEELDMIDNLIGVIKIDVHEE